LLADALRRHVVLIICMSLLGLSLGLVFGLTREAQYTASTVALVNPLDGNPFFPSSRGEQLINMLTEAQLVRSDAVANEVAKQTGSSDTAVEILENTDVEVPPNTQILRISYDAPSEDVALTRSQAFADQYLAYRQRRAQNLVSKEVETLQVEIDEVQQEIAVTAEEIRDAEEGSVDVNLLTEESRVLGTRLNQLQDRLTEIATTPVDPGQVVTPAAIVARPGIVTPASFAAVGLLGGAILAYLLALARERADLRIRTENDVKAVGINVLGEVSTADPASGINTILASPSNDYRRLRAALMSVLPDKPLTIVVTSAGNTEDAPETIVRLANAFARSNIVTTVVAVGGPLGGLDEEIATRSRGLAGVLLEEVQVGSALVDVRPGLRVLPTGDGYDAVKDLVVEPTIADIMATLRPLADFVLVGAPTIHEAEGQTVTHLADFVLLEVTKRKTTSTQLEHALDECRRAGTPVLGVVMVRRRRHRLSRRRPRALTQKSGEQPLENPSQAASEDTPDKAVVNGNETVQSPEEFPTPGVSKGDEDPHHRKPPDVGHDEALRKGAWTRT
jgi:capsular polysaccharide biosynthesis protein